MKIEYWVLWELMEDLVYESFTDNIHNMESQA